MTTFTPTAYPPNINIEQLTVLLDSGAAGIDVDPSLPVISITNDESTLTIVFTNAVSGPGATALNSYITISTPATDPNNPQTAVYSSDSALFGTTCNIVTSQSVDRTYTVPDAPDDTFTLTNASQTLTNKTITDVSNIVAANSLKVSGGGLVDVDMNGAPTAGWALIADSSTAASWAPIPGGNFGQFFVQASGVANIVTTVSTTGTAVSFVFSVGTTSSGSLSTGVSVPNGTYLITASIVWWLGSSATTSSANFDLREGIGAPPTVTIASVQMSNNSSVARRNSSSPFAIRTLAGGAVYNYGLFVYRTGAGNLNVLANAGGIVGTTMMFYRLA